MIGKAVSKKFREERARVVVRCAVGSVEESAIEVKDEEELLWVWKRDWGGGSKGEMARVRNWNMERLHRLFA